MPQNPRQQSVMIKVHCLYQHAGLVNCFEVKNPFCVQILIRIFVFFSKFEYQIIQTKHWVLAKPDGHFGGPHPFFVWIFLHLVAVDDVYILSGGVGWTWVE